MPSVLPGFEYDIFISYRQKDNKYDGWVTETKTMKMIPKVIKWSTLLLCLITGTLTAQIKLPSFFSSNMVLQQGIEIPVWGWAAPGEEITITLEGNTASSKAESNGKWSVKLPSMNYGGPYIMTITGSNKLILENIMVGEVWVCSGQSNMEFNLINAKNAEAEIASSGYPDMRLFTVKKRIAQTPQDQLDDGEWMECSPVSSSRFSAVAYFFGKELYEKLKIPVGLINTSWGGTVAETWISEETMAQNPDFAKQLSQLKKVNLDDYARTIEKEGRERVGEFSTVDRGMKRNKPVWAAFSFDDSAWKTMELPDYIENNGLEGVDGIIWFRREIDISPAEAGKTATLHLAKVNDSDNTYLNGTLIGSTKLMAEKLRIYEIPAGLLKSGKNILTVRVEDIGGNCGIHGDTATLYLQCENHDIPLGGEWKYKIGLVKFNANLNPNSYPTLLYNGMINPLVTYGIRGVIWYQGESNAGRAKQYQKVFPDLIKDWRDHWNQGEFPFLFVQLTNFMMADSMPSESSWAELREAQSKTLALPNTGMAVTIDVGDSIDIHPKDKQSVGRRLALSALKIAYNQDILFSGPVYNQMSVKGSTVTLSFDQVGNGLKVNDKYGYLKGFAIAGQDHRFYWAKAVITGKNSIEVSCPEVQDPVAVRYGWGNNPDDANLYNSADLPASPFRTDQWKGITE
ncbi:MAG: 9-O-acetylesterase [Bacteroidia bacterium]|nr:9-O-acetylesterase [Bacteroidia bacterium]